MGPNPISWFEIYVDDMERAKNFYEAVFEVELNALGGGPTGELDMKSFPQSFENYGASGALVSMPGFSPGRNSTLVYFSCDDCAVEESRIETAGGKIERGKTPIGEYGFVTLAYDTEGNMFGLHSMN